MDGSIILSAQDRKVLLQAYRSGTDARTARRVHLILLRADGLSWQQIKTVLFCSFDLISQTLKAFSAGGVAAVLGQRLTKKAIPAWLRQVLRWLTTSTPRDFGYFRSRWSCETLAHLLAWETGQRLSGETIRRGLHRLGFVWRRPRPVIGPVDPLHAKKLREIRQLLTDLPPHEAAVFEDEVDVQTPGNNRKCHVAGSLVWKTGTLLVSSPTHRRNTAQFLSHLDPRRTCRAGLRMVPGTQQPLPRHATYLRQSRLTSLRFRCGPI